MQAVKADAEPDGSEVRDPNGRKPLDPDPRVVPPPVDVFVDACGSARRSRRADPARFFHPPAIPAEGEVDSDGLAPSRALLRALLYPRLAESGAKVILNALSTAAHALVGKTHAGRMIDLRVSNAKLWRRAVGVVAEAAGTTEALAESALRWAQRGDGAAGDAYDGALNALGTRGAPADPRGARGTDRLLVAEESARLVPTAVLLAADVGFAAAREAREALGEGTVRDALEKARARMKQVKVGARPR